MYTPRSSSMSPSPNWESWGVRNTWWRMFFPVVFPETSLVWTSHPPVTFPAPHGSRPSYHFRRRTRSPQRHSQLKVPVWVKKAFLWIKFSNLNLISPVTMVLVLWVPGLGWLFCRTTPFLIDFPSFISSVCVALLWLLWNKLYLFPLLLPFCFIETGSYPIDCWPETQYKA